MEEMNQLIPVDIKADLHNHTRSSDGRQSSFRAILRAYSEGMNVISITDHNSVKGYKNLELNIYSIVEELKYNRNYDLNRFLNMFEDIRIIKGTELITTYKGVIVEVLGYNFDVDKMDKEIEYLKITIKEKAYVCLYKKLRKIIDELQLVFDKSVLDEAYQKVLIEGKGGVVSPFFNEIISHKENIKYLKYIDENEQEKTANTLKLFIDKHLYNKKSVFFVDMSNSRPTFKDTIDAIHRAGGQAFLAHAGRYQDKMPVKDYIDDMIDYGLDGLEVFYPDHSFEFRQFLLNKVKQYNLKASGGSDDHHSEKEGLQYYTGRVAIPNIPQTIWIKDTIMHKKDFFSESIIIQSSIQDLIEISEQNRKI